MGQMVEDFAYRCRVLVPASGIQMKKEFGLQRITQMDTDLLSVLICVFSLLALPAVSVVQQLSSSLRPAAGTEETAGHADSRPPPFPC
jgi:hypothetical protein